MNDVDIFLVIVGVIVGSFILVFGTTYLIIAHCSTDENRFAWLPYGPRYKQCCGIRTGPVVELSSDLFDHYTIDINEIHISDEDLFNTYNDKLTKEYDFL